MGKFDPRSDEGIFLGYSSTNKAYQVYNKRTMKVMQTVNVVINESSDSSFEKGIEELTREIIPPEPRVVQEVVEQEPASPSTPGTPSVVEDSTDITTSPDSESHKKKGPSSKIKQNHPLKDIVEPTKVKEALQDEVGLKQCTMNCFSFKGMMSGPWYLDRRVNTSSAPSGFSGIRLMRMAM